MMKINPIKSIGIQIEDALFEYIKTKAFNESSQGTVGQYREQAREIIEQYDISLNIREGVLIYCILRSPSKFVWETFILTETKQGIFDVKKL